MKRFFLLCCATACFLLTVPLHAQDAFDRFTAEIGGGVTVPLGATNDRAGTGGNFVAAGGYRFNPRTSLVLDFTYNGMDLDFLNTGGTDTTIDANMRLWSLSINPAFEWVKTENFSSYVTGGYGVYKRTLELTRADFEPAIFCDDWWGICAGGIVSGETVIGDRSTYKGGFNVGTGVTFGERTKLFVEVRYHRMFTTNRDTEVMPITFGVRW